MSKTIIRLEAYTNLRIALQSGTLITPASDKSDSQNLILADDTETECSEGENELVLETFCFNLECPAPSDQQYFMGTLKFVEYKKGMDQSEVWELTIKQKTYV